MSIVIVRNGDTLLSQIKYILIRFQNISSSISFVEENQYSPGQFIFDRTITVQLNYYTFNDGINGKNHDIKALKSDWLCSKCYFYNIYMDHQHLTNKEEKKNNNNNNNKPKRNKCGRSDCNASMSLDSVRIDSLTGNPYICGEIIVDKVKGNRINLKSNAVLVIEGIDINTSEDIIKHSFKQIGNIESVYIVNKCHYYQHHESNLDESGVLKGCIAFLQFLTSNEAKAALKQALLNNITISHLPINLSFIQYDNTHLNQLNDATTNLALSMTTKINNDIHDTFIHNLQQQAQWTNATDPNGATNGAVSAAVLPTMPMVTAAIAVTAAQANNLLMPKATDFGIADTFQWDPSANCFYDPNSGYYFDIHRHLYYFNGHFYNWDIKQQQYVKVKDPHAATNDDDDDDEEAHNNNDDDDDDNKDEDGDVNMNKDKDKEQEQSGPIKFGFKLGKSGNNNNGNDSPKITDNTQKGNVNKLEITQKQLDMMNDLPQELQNKVNKFCNGDKLCCYLCKRKFKNINNLSDHIKLSQFHLYHLSKWIISKRIEINNVAAKFYSSISNINMTESNIKTEETKKIKKEEQEKEKEILKTEDASLQDEFLQIMSSYNNSRCDKSSDGGMRALMK